MRISKPTAMEGNEDDWSAGNHQARTAPPYETGGRSKRKKQYSRKDNVCKNAVKGSEKEHPSDKTVCKNGISRVPKRGCILRTMERMRPSVPLQRSRAESMVSAAIPPKTQTSTQIERIFAPAAPNRPRQLCYKGLLEVSRSIGRTARKAR